MQSDVILPSPFWSCRHKIRSCTTVEEKRENRPNSEPPRLNIKSGVCVCRRVCRASRVRFPAFPAVPILCKKPNSEGQRGGHTPTHCIPPQLEICPLGHTHRKLSKDEKQQLSKRITSQRHVNQKATFILRFHHLDKGHCNWKLRRSTLSVFSPLPHCHILVFPKSI